MSYAWYFLSSAADKTRVSKEFYLKTISIDESHIVNEYKVKDETTALSLMHKRGKHQMRPE